MSPRTLLSLWAIAVLSGVVGFAAGQRIGASSRQEFNERLRVGESKVSTIELEARRLLEDAESKKQTTAERLKEPIAPRKTSPFGDTGSVFVTKASLGQIAMGPVDHEVIVSWEDASKRSWHSWRVPMKNNGTSPFYGWVLVDFVDSNGRSLAHSEAEVHLSARETEYAYGKVGLTDAQLRQRSRVVARLCLTRTCT